LGAVVEHDLVVDGHGVSVLYEVVVKKMNPKIQSV
jgi:hypothetical protein